MKTMVSASLEDHFQDDDDPPLLVSIAAALGAGAVLWLVAGATLVLLSFR